MSPRQLLPLCFASGTVLLAVCSAAQSPNAHASAGTASALPTISAAVDQALARANTRPYTQDITPNQRNAAHAPPEARTSPQGDIDACHRGSRQPGCN